MTTAQKLQAFAAATQNQLFDPEFQGGEWMVHDVETHETLDHWTESSKQWNERSIMKRGEIAGFPFLAWKNTQLRKGQERTSRSVIDFGDVRFAIECDLTNYE